MAVVSLFIGALGAAVAFGSVLWLVAGLLGFIADVVQAHRRRLRGLDDDSALALSA